MKTILFSLFLYIHVLYLCGQQNYNRALIIIRMNEAITDSEISMVLFENGFDIEIMSEPTIYDYIMSNFRTI